MKKEVMNLKNKERYVGVFGEEMGVRNVIIIISKIKEVFLKEAIPRRKAVSGW